MSHARRPCHDDTMTYLRSLHHRVRELLMGARQFRLSMCRADCRVPCRAQASPAPGVDAHVAVACLDPPSEPGSTPRQTRTRVLGPGRIRPCDLTPWCPWSDHHLTAQTHRWRNGSE